MKHAPFEYRQHVRLEAAELFAKGLSKTNIAKRLGVCRQTVSGWYRQYSSHGVDGLKIGTPGRQPRLSQAQWRAIEGDLLRGPRACGYDTDLWTLERIADLIKKKTGVCYNSNYVWKLMKRLNWSCQKPERKAKERNEDGIARWKAEEWPRIKRGQ